MDYIEFFKKDKFAVKSGIEILEAAPGHAVTRLVVTDEHLNAGGVTQGGAVFTLADVAMAVAINAHGRLAFSIEMDIRFLQSSTTGDTLTATTREIELRHTIGHYQVEIKNQHGEPIAIAMGMCHRKKTENIL